jgi:ion channel POLLUX/CASTOR
MRPISLSDRLRYAFDNTIARGPVALVAWLGLIAAVLVLAATGIVLLLSPAAPDQMSSPAVLWNVMFQALTPNPVDPSAGPLIYLLAMLFITFASIFIVSMLIGILTSGLEGKVQELRKGRSLVVETGHTVILGWSEQIYTILSELSAANANRARSCIAILADRDKVEMEDDIRAKVGSTGRTRVVCRAGSPLDLADLEIVNPHAARSVIILSPDAPDPDSHVIKAILAITNNPRRRSEPYHIVAEIRDPKNMEAARLVGCDEATLVLAGDTISRITVQTCRQAGLSVVYTELLNFGGDEIYFQEEPALTGRMFGEAILAYEDSCVIGLRTKNGVRLNPPMDTVIAAGDNVIAISEDDDTVRLSGKSEWHIETGAIRKAGSRRAKPERTLILGWNQRGLSILRELDAYVVRGSTAVIVADTGTLRETVASATKTLKNLRLTVREADTTDRRVLDSLNVEAFQHVITLAYSESLDVQASDAKTLITLLHLRDIAGRKGHAFSIVSEMLDVRNRELADVTRADDFIVSETLISLLLSQLAEKKALMPVFADLFDPGGSELYLKPAEDYVAPGIAVNFYTVTEAARRRGEVAIGYRLAAEADDSSKAHGVHVNPDKSRLLPFAIGDKVIVLAES